MSHFSVLVQIPKAIMEEGSVESYLEEVLAPFDENKEVEAYLDVPADEVEKEYQRCLEKYPEDYAGKTKQEWAKVWYGRELEEDGSKMTNYNPKSKWDWWEVGGRWSKMLKLNNGENVDIAQVKDIDFEGIIEDNRQRMARAWDEAEGSNIQGRLRKYIYGITAETKEEHIASAIGLTTFAVINKEGEWLEKGSMGWFGCSSETEDEAKAWEDNFEKNFISPLDPLDGIAIIGCHI